MQVGIQVMAEICQIIIDGFVVVFNVACRKCEGNIGKAVEQKEEQK